MFLRLYDYFDNFWLIPASRFYLRCTIKVVGIIHDFCRHFKPIFTVLKWLLLQELQRKISFHFDIILTFWHCYPAKIQLHSRIGRKTQIWSCKLIHWRICSVLQHCVGIMVHVQDQIEDHWCLRKEFSCRSDLRRPSTSNHR